MKQDDFRTSLGRLCASWVIMNFGHPLRLTNRFILLTRALDDESETKSRYAALVDAHVYKTPCTFNSLDLTFLGDG